MTDGRPLTGPANAASLVTRDGTFPRFPNGLGDLHPAEVRREWEAQMAAFQACGLAPTHIDTHHHVHAHPRAFPVYCEIAQKYGLPARTLSAEMTRELRARGVRCADLSAEWSAGRETLLQTVSGLYDAAAGAGTVEIICHPGRVDAALESASVLVAARERELEVLCAPGLREMLAAQGIKPALPSA